MNQALFRNKEVIEGIVNKLKEYKGPPLKLMEVCGSHTMAISKFGIRSLLPENIQLYSGPGCPVCVTPSYFIKAALELTEREDVIMTTFGDMMKIPYEGDDLLQKKALGKDIRIVYSPLDNLEIAKENPEKKVVFLSVGFETTTPIIASSVVLAQEEGIRNYYLLTANKTIDMPLKVLSSDSDLGINGYIYPGHVSTIIGDSLYHDISKEYGLPGVITGFEPVDILGAIQLLVDNVSAGKADVVNLYSRVARSEGNPTAREIMHEVFEDKEANWRGIGVIPESGMALREKYSHMDAWQLLRPDVADNVKEHEECKCGEILKGKCLPTDCALFGKACTPENPVGACMVSSEGTCAAYYRYS